jgi:glycosyltransferase involved in cell wall biosynthesis
MKVFRNIDRNKIIFDFFVSDHKACYYDNEIKELGGRIFFGEFKSIHPVKSFTKIFSTVKKESYQVVFRCTEHPIAYLDLLAAKLGGAKVMMVRSTNTSAGGGVVSNILAAIFRPLLNSISTIKIAPSSEAGIWLFGKKQMDFGKVRLLNNGIELDKFIFNQEIRDLVRQEFSLEDKFVVGHVGRFSAQKNHIFLLDIFSIVAKKRTDAVLMLVGQGELEDEIRRKIASLGLTSRVLFMGVRSDVNRLMMAMDLFVFPSRYEGMPNTVIEAQATGLSCIISDTITKEASITDHVKYISINEKAEYWAEAILSTPNLRNVAHLKELFEEKGYNILNTSEFIAESVVERI